MNNGAKPGLIRVEDIARIRKEMYIGKVLNETVYLDKLGERLVVPTCYQTEVCGIYPHLVEVRRKGEPARLPIKTITYVELLLKQMEEAKGEANV